MKPLVSIITPCHNSGKFIHRLLDSILIQTYERVEMYIIDNDSKDNTADIVQNYILKFKEKGYFLNYLHQGDKGPSSAINRGLKLIQGDYLLMPDSDDWYAVDNFIELMVSKFEELPEDYAVVRCQEQEIKDGTMEKLNILGRNAKDFDPGTLFDDCLYSRNGYYYPSVGYMLKVSSLRKVTNMDIYEAYNVGQNRQTMLPLYYNYKCYTVLAPLVFYLVRSNSISHGDYTKYNVMVGVFQKFNEYIDGILNRIEQMDTEERVMYKKKFLYVSSQDMSYIALSNKKFKDAFSFRAQMKLYGVESFKEKIVFYHSLVLSLIK